MSGVWEDDSWKRADDKRPKVAPTRAEMQARINAQYATGKISLSEWRRGTNHLSACAADGEPIPCSKLP